MNTPDAILAAVKKNQGINAVDTGQIIGQSACNVRKVCAVLKDRGDLFIQSGGQAKRYFTPEYAIMNKIPLVDKDSSRAPYGSRMVPSKAEKEVKPYIDRWMWINSLMNQGLPA